jgi:hypothetical protein
MGNSGNAEIRTAFGGPPRGRWRTRLKGGDIASISVHGVFGVAHLVDNKFRLGY